MHCKSCGKPIVEGSTFCRYCGASQQASESASSDMASIAGVFQEIEDEKPHEPTFREYVRSHTTRFITYRLYDKTSYQDYLASKARTKRSIVVQLFSTIVVVAVVVGLGIVAMFILGLLRLG